MIFKLIIGIVVTFYVGSSFSMFQFVGGESCLIEGKIKYNKKSKEPYLFFNKGTNSEDRIKLSNLKDERNSLEALKVRIKLKIIDPKKLSAKVIFTEKLKPYHRLRIYNHKIEFCKIKKVNK